MRLFVILSDVEHSVPIYADDSRFVALSFLVQMLVSVDHYFRLCPLDVRLLPIATRQENVGRSATVFPVEIVNISKDQ